MLIHKPLIFQQESSTRPCADDRYERTGQNSWGFWSPRLERATLSILPQSIPQSKVTSSPDLIHEERDTSGAKGTAVTQQKGMNTGNPLYFRTSSRMENKNTVESIHCFTGKKHAPGSLFGYLRYWKTTKPRIWGRVSLTLISLRLDWPACALSHEIKQYTEKRKTFIPLQCLAPG